MRNPVVGQRVIVKAERAEAYGLPRGAYYTVARVYSYHGRKTMWVDVRELPVGNNTFTQSDLIAAKG